MFIDFHFSAFIPVIDLQSDQYSNHYQEYFANGIGEVTSNPISCLTGRQVGEEFLADFAEELDHGISLDNCFFPGS
ncbi:hypothetical protein [Aquiflexum balticum]|uniref:hypothetical protein n=1 Tax=Aquiflexum balticum TaxID=280473 RepID=UPI0012FA92D0|nr:hypothetical protein [Aquiflexum balticum]